VRRLIMARCVGRALGKGEEFVASAGGLFVVDGRLETDAGPRRVGTLIDPGESCRATTDARVLQLPHLTRVTDAEEDRGAP